MINISLEKNPLMQLNLLIWMSLKGRESWINPYFNNKGYDILVIEPEMTLPPRHINVLNQNNIQFIDNPKPEVIFINKNKKNFLIIECKNQCFNLDNNNTRSTKQATSFLIYNADLISESFGIEAENFYGLLNYNFVKSDYLSEFSETIIELSKDLGSLFNEKTNLPSTSYFSEEDNNLFLNFIDPDNSLSDMNFKDKVRVMNLEKNTTLTPLYLIPLDSSGETDEYGEIVFYKRLKSNFGVFLGQLDYSDNNEEVILDIETDILENVIKIWNNWNNAETKRFIRNKARIYLNKIISILDQNIENFNYKSINDGYSLDIKDRNTITDLRKEFLKVEIKREDEAVKKHQLSLNLNNQ
ncbi:hypothetical protein DFR79_101215 [Halanaerobium saccharolyticum]|uniref:Uncharacterized protein n=1 Tax=Halanaerobium saccharolyticum TaxID=43595 RepID=A0A4R6M233_9FIRM|nr:hypothetical protein [Halanaerobium saccharolyticum]TDO95214.1 hypothetical protein DFR79_101215 [Halanaerobium saccharolyticum]